MGLYGPTPDVETLRQTVWSGRFEPSESGFMLSYSQGSGPLEKIFDVFRLVTARPTTCVPVQILHVSRSRRPFASVRGGRPLSFLPPSPVTSSFAVISYLVLPVFLLARFPFSQSSPNIC